MRKNIEIHLTCLLCMSMHAFKSLCGSSQAFYVNLCVLENGFLGPHNFTPFDDEQNMFFNDDATKKRENIIKNDFLFLENKELKKGCRCLLS